MRAVAFQQFLFFLEQIGLAVYRRQCAGALPVATASSKFPASACAAASVRRISEEVKRGRLDPEDITEQVISDHLWTRNIPDPDLLIRTSGEMRVSNFLLWQISYSELVITPTLWPDFRKPQFYAALE
jgi:undecaprenyl diphosphate synthase